MAQLRGRRVALVLAGAAVAFWTAASSRAAAPEPEIVRAVKSGHTREVERLIAGNRDVNATQPDGTSALHWAIRANNVALVIRLIQAGANVNAASRYGVTPLSLAAGGGNAEILEGLLKAGANPGQSESVLRDGETLLMLASKAGNAAAGIPVLEQKLKDAKVSLPKRN